LRVKGFCLVALQSRAGLQFFQQLFELTHGALSLLVMLVARQLANLYCFLSDTKPIDKLKNRD
jgi:predicted ATPase